MPLRPDWKGSNTLKNKVSLNMCRRTPIFYFLSYQVEDQTWFFPVLPHKPGVYVHEAIT